MFVRKKKNNSGIISVQVIEKRSGKYKMLKTIGSSRHEKEVSLLVQRGEDFIKKASGQVIIEFDTIDFSKQVAKSIESIDIAGFYY